jgi:hypothetical protein
MIDEFFILKSSNLVYHYSNSKKAKDIDKAILSSGLLSALDTFTKQARSDRINFFQTEKEIFKFAAIPDSEYILVFVFKMEVFNENISNLIIQNIYDLVLNSEIIHSGSKLVDLEDGSSYQLSSGIEYILTFKLVQQFSDKHLSEIINKEKNFEFCVIKENPKGDVKASFSKRIGYLSKSFLNNHDLIISVINKALGNLELSKKYLIITFESQDQQFLIFNMDSYSISLLSSEIKSSEYYLDFLKNFAFSSNLFNFARYKMANFEISTKYLRDSSGKIIFKEGIILPKKAKIFLGTLSNNISNFSKEVLSKSLQVFSIVYENKKNELSLLKGNLDTNNEMELVIYVD